MPYRYGQMGGLRKVLALVLTFGVLLLNTGEGMAKERPVRILAFGDSLTQGYGLIEDFALVPRLQAWLDAQGVQATIVNGGVSGDTTAGGAERIEWSLTPDIAGVIVTLGGNDMLRGLPPEEAHENLEKIILIAREKGVGVMLIGMDAPLNYGPDYKQSFEALYPELAEKYELRLIPSYLAPLGETPAEALEWMQADGIHPNAKGVEKIVDAIGPDVRAFAEGLQKSD